MPTPRVEVLAIGHSAYGRSIFVDEFPLENCKLETPAMLEGEGKASSRRVSANGVTRLSLWSARNPHFMRSGGPRRLGFSSFTWGSFPGRVRVINSISSTEPEQ